ncbi:hypothetical protein IMG5_057100 [Ichthyophthirius multifiliis]|uniref:Ion transport domain-containing protein n=1 Tax=Ichthyophthirius multifiliis TaxID=5932 RepID=G0QNC2_ICHMU|nr:hypothetical protein IMG5_057100 [Ichthyophthirius multifiliis]EGR33287.1 hypothetical protein IMG5_057100 [Ichthyophthirius multifiliis]|eukprot:XP_004037273.1 hypothetical protein IMG5_057100 [Ichthyophthirius multifiliis]
MSLKFLIRIKKLFANNLNIIQKKYNYIILYQLKSYKKRKSQTRKIIPTLNKNQSKYEEKQNLLKNESQDSNRIIQCNPHYFYYFKKQLGITQVKKNGIIKKIYFQKPFTSYYINEYIKKSIVKQKYFIFKYYLFIQFFFLKNNFLKKQNKMRVMHFFSIQYLIFFTYFNCYILQQKLIIQNIQIQNLELITFNGRVEENENQNIIKQIIFAFTVIQLIISSFVFIFCAVEKFEISINQYSNTDSLYKIQKIQQSAGLLVQTKYTQIKNYWLQLFDIFKPEQMDKNSCLIKYIKYTILLLIDKDNFYHLIYLLITIVAFNIYGPIVYAFLLLDIVKRSQNLKNIIRSITENLYNIFIFAYLGLIIMYIYGIGGFLYFRKSFENSEKVYGQNFILVISSTIKEGLRNGGGISEAIQAQPYDNNGSNSLYWARYFYDLTFFVFINMLFIQIIFGIILDTFAELRQQNDQIMDAVKNKCYVCGTKKSIIDSKSQKGWYSHIYLEHNVYHLLFFMIYVYNKDVTNCDALEKYVKKCLEQNKIDFIPLNEFQ